MVDRVVGNVSAAAVGVTAAPRVQGNVAVGPTRVPTVLGPEPTVAAASETSEPEVGRVTKTTTGKRASKKASNR